MKGRGLGRRANTTTNNYQYYWIFNIEIMDILFYYTFRSP